MDMLLSSQPQRRSVARDRVPVVPPPRAGRLLGVTCGQVS